MFGKRLYAMVLGTVIVAVTVLMAALAPGHETTVAQEQEGYYSYAVKFVCGFQRPDPNGVQAVTPVTIGRYATEINIYNHNLNEVHIDKKILLLTIDGHVLGREPEQVGPSAFDQIDLLPGQATLDDCYRIAELVNLNPTAYLQTFIGYFVIESKVELDVNAVYTTGPMAGRPWNMVPAIEIENIPGVFITQ